MIKPLIRSNRRSRNGIDVDSIKIQIYMIYLLNIFIETLNALIKFEKNIS